MADVNFKPMSTIGVVADIRRDGECDHVAVKCSVFGINEDEYNSLASICEIRPKYYTEEAHRFMVHCRYIKFFFNNFLWLSITSKDKIIFVILMYFYISSLVLGEP